MSARKRTARLSRAMLQCLRDAERSADGSVRVRGYGIGFNASTTGQALAVRGMLARVRDAARGGTIYRITDAGRAALVFWSAESIAERAKVEILADVRAGALPADVPTFSALHDHCDANMLMFAGTDGSMPYDVGNQRDADVINEAFDLLDAWIRAGGMRVRMVCPAGCTNEDGGTCPRCYAATGNGCGHGPLCHDCKHWKTYGTPTSRKEDKS